MRTLIISDLHLGNGGPYDVFMGGNALPALLDHLGRTSLRVFINGDGADFLMNDDPLELDESRAQAQAEAIVRDPKSAAVLLAFGRVLARGGEVTFRLGNHDIELSLPAVQAVFRRALGQPVDVAERLAFVPGNTPEILTIGDVRLLITHGEQDDQWNKVDYNNLHTPKKRYVYAPGSVLVKKILNPGTSTHGLRFLSLLKPDFQGAALSALAVDPTIAKQLFKGATLRILAQLFDRKNMAATFAEEEEPLAESIFDLGDEPPTVSDENGFSVDNVETRLASIRLDEDEQEALSSMLGETMVATFGNEDDAEILDRASVKIAKAALAIYGGIQRRLVGTEGDAIFALEPTVGEWSECRRLAEKFNVNAVILGHTHAARWKEEKGFLYANTGTWIGLMALPASNAPDEEWAEYLTELRQNRTLDPSKQRRAVVHSRFTAALVDALPSSGAAVSLVEWDGAQLKTLGCTQLLPATNR